MELIKLLAEAQSEMTNPPLNGEAQIGQRKYKYALLSDVIASVKPPLTKRGIFLTQHIDNNSHVLVTEVYRGEEQMLLDIRPIAVDGRPQENGAAETYAKRYALCSVFCIVGEEDTDAQGIEAPRTPVDEERNRAVVRLNDALALYVSSFGGDIESLKEGIRTRADFMDSAQYYNKVAYTYEQAVKESANG